LVFKPYIWDVIAIIFTLYALFLSFFLLNLFLRMPDTGKDGKRIGWKSKSMRMKFITAAGWSVAIAILIFFIAITLGVLWYVIR